MRSITRPLAATAASALLVLGLAACGDDDADPKADDAGTGATASSTPTDGTEGATPSGGASADGSVATGGAPATVAPEAKEMCAAVTEIIKVVSAIPGPDVTEAQWKQIQEAYIALDDVDLPPGASADQAKGRDVIVDAIRGLSYAEALKAFKGDSGGKIPGVSAADTAKAESFFTWAGVQCPGAAGAAQSATAPEASVTAE